MESGSCNADSSPCKPIKLENMSRKIHGPLPQIPLVPTGGITAENAGEFIKAGAALVCVGSWLVDKKAVAEGRYEILTQRAHALMEAVKRAREKLREK
ncbi:MAG: thiamine phosphate synthase [Methanomassiliicoccales archaeon]|nr:thiamine phosphate synthase [Methanomassiliicoccales archaeon]